MTFYFDYDEEYPGLYEMYEGDYSDLWDADDWDEYFNFYGLELALYLVELDNDWLNYEAGLLHPEVI